MPSSPGALAPSLFALLYHFVQIRYWTYLEKRPILQGRMLRHELNGMIHVACLKHEQAAELLLGFRVRTVGRRDFAVFPIQGPRCFGRLKSFPSTKVPVGAQMVVILEAFVEHCVLLFLGHGSELSRLDISQTDVFQRFLLVRCESENGRSSFCYELVVG